MTLLFASSSVRQRLEQIMGLTWTHGKNLALFVGGYKLLLEVGRVAKGDKAIQVRVGTAEGARIDQMLWGITMHTPHRRSRYDSDRTLLLDAYIGSSMWTVPYYNNASPTWPNTSLAAAITGSPSLVATQTQMQAGSHRVIASRDSTGVPQSRESYCPFIALGARHALTKVTIA